MNVCHENKFSISLSPSLPPFLSLSVSVCHFAHLQSRRTKELEREDAACLEGCGNVYAL